MTVTFATKIKDVSAADWDNLSGDENPFISHTFLAALEASGSLEADKGWQPWHLLIHDEKQKLTSACPLYLKGHSMGEYVFDQGWANAFTEAGGQYYPKLLSAIPFTPVSAPKLLGHKEPLAAAIKAEVEAKKLSSAHVLFINSKEKRLFEAEGFLIRKDQQFHWNNRGFKTFGDFLETLNSQKRKTIKRERKLVRKDGLDIKWIVGKEITENDWDFFFRCYNETCLKRWGQPYLTREFFSLIGQSMPENIRLCVASENGENFAAALHLVGGNRLYGRYWGTLALKNFLHFELCYYQAIELAIAEGLEVIEAGAQGTHKLFRGYEPVTTTSAHWISHPGFREAVENFLTQERKMVKEENLRLKEAVPFKKS